MKRKFSKEQTIRNTAIKTWHGQTYRCNNPDDLMYKYYGAKGVQVKYSKEEFVSWFIKEHKKKQNWSRASVGRIDHSGHYEISNIEMIESSENTKEMLKRTGGNKCGTVTVVVHPDRTDVFRSLSLAARSLGVCPASVWGRIQLQGKKTKNNEWLRKNNVEIYTLDQFMELK